MPKPFDYYYTKYQNGVCPWCGLEDGIAPFEGRDVRFCKFYGGYIAEAQCDVQYDGECEGCKYHDLHYYYLVAPGFLCEQCHHGVHFGKRVAFQELFHKHDYDDCKHCTWHNTRSPSNPMQKPKN
jgi:hypothetical protein